MLEIFLTSSVLIAALALMRRLLRGRIHPRLQYALWLLVAVRLLLPVSLVKSPVSVMNAMQERVIVTQRLTAPENRRAPQTGGGESQVQAQPDAEFIFSMHRENTPHENNHFALDKRKLLCYNAVNR